MEKGEALGRAAAATAAYFNNFSSSVIWSLKHLWVELSGAFLPLFLLRFHVMIK